MKIIAIIQARMSSTRLPGKVLKEISGKPMLWYVVNRTLLSPSIDKVIIATSIDDSDDPIAAFCEKEKIECFRGDLENVLSRYWQVAKNEGADVIIRVTGDCPFVDGKLIEEGIKDFLDSGVDYLSNTIERTYPRGFDFEIFTHNSLDTAYKNAVEEPEKEHVTPYIWRNHPEGFKIKYFKEEKDKSNFRITVDNRKDLEAAKILIERYNADKKNYLEIIKLLEAHPEIVAINKNVEQKHYGQ